MKPTTTKAFVVDFVTDKIVDGWRVTGYAIVTVDRKTAKREPFAFFPVYPSRDAYLPAMMAARDLAAATFGNVEFKLGGGHGLDLRGAL